MKNLNNVNRWRDSNNPLRGLTMPRAVSLMESAQRGIMSDLQWLYAAETGIEATDPDLMAIIERTLSGVADCEWEIGSIAEDSLGFDKVLADEQAAYLRESYTQCDNLDDAIEHLVMARFRGFSHLSPWLSDDWSLEHLEPLPQYNMVRNGTRKDWAWNPKANQTAYAAMSEDQRLSPDDYIIMTAARPVNRIGLIKYVRSTLSEKDWDGYVEIYGIPGVFIIMPDQVPNGKENEYRDLAADAAEAASGALPSGSDVKTLSEARGMQPFQARLEWLQKQLVLAGTGGLLTMLTESGSGTLAGGAHTSVWEQIIRRVARQVGTPLNRQYDRPALAARFPGYPAQAFFNLRARQEKDISKVVTNVTTLITAGFDLDPDQVQKETGYTINGFTRPVGATPVSPYPFTPPTPIKADVPATPAAPAATPTATSAENSQEAKVAETGMNGAQVTALLNVVSKVMAGELTRAAAPFILQAAFPLLSPEKIEQMLPTPEEIQAASASPATGAMKIAARKTDATPTPDAFIESATDALAQAQAIANKPLAAALNKVLAAPDLKTMQVEAAKLREQLPAMAESMLSDPATAAIYHKIMSSAFLQGATQEKKTK